MKKIALIATFIVLTAVAIFQIRNMVSSRDQPLPEPVRMAYLQNDIHHLALWVALDKGFFRDEGVDVQISGIFRAGPEIMNAFSAGALDMAYVGEAPSTFAVANVKSDVKVVAQVNTEGSALVVAAGQTDIEDVSALKGKNVAIPGHATVQDFLLKKALTTAGVDPSEVNLIILKPPEMIGALRSGQIDAFIAWEPYPSKAFIAGVGRVLAGSHDIWPDHPCCVLVSDTAFMEAHPARVAKVLRAHVRATDFIKANPEEALRVGVKYTGMDKATVRKALRSVTYTYIPSIEGEKEYVRFLSELGYIKVSDPDSFVSGFIKSGLLDRIEDR
ncbi:MAG: ABC transporter substrate-binding protein [Deltaproteobacteria bacterium]|nr:ABC transporter substrate-binding protein [Deltaproteobacteria bacterium]